MPKPSSERPRSLPIRILSGLGSFLSAPWVWIPGLFIVALLSGLTAGSWKNLCADCPSIAQIHTWEPEQTSKVFGHDGRLIAEIGTQARTYVSIHDLPPHVPQAFMAIEDRRFYEHRGVDIRGLTRAVTEAILTASLSGGGGSTITQQLARNMFQETIGFEKRVERKLKELQVALELERAYSKDQILEAYMNQINLGLGIWGIHTASRYYFGKEPADMTPADAAILAAVANNPRRFSPFINPENSKRRRDLVLDRMARERFIPRDEARAWQESPLPVQDGQGSGRLAGYFVEWVRDQMLARFPGQVNTAGLRIFTTLDLDIQEMAEVSVAWGAERIENRPGFRHPRFSEFADQRGGFADGATPYVQGILIALDPETGAVRALVGGRDVTQSKFNRAIQARRQPGSSFKTLVYTAAIASGMPASMIIRDEPIVREQVDGTEWRPQNFDRTFEGDMTLREAFRRSINTVAIRLADEEVGLETVAQTARRMGIRTEIPRVPSIAIGAADVIPIQMAEAFATLANLGERVTPHPILRVESADGEVLWEPQYPTTRVLERPVARVMVSLMEDVVLRGTGASSRAETGGRLPAGVPAGGKTGTSNNNTDVWFIGATPNLQVTVWFGMDNPQSIYSGATGGGDAAPVFGHFLRQVYFGRDAVETADGQIIPARAAALPIPAPWPMEGLIPVEVDDRTGLLASPWCPADRRYTEWFIPGTEPTQPCEDRPAARRFRMFP